MHRTYLLLGSNLGDRRAHLADAIHRLTGHGIVRRRSLVYRSAAWGNIPQPDFLNMTLEFGTALPPDQLLAAILSIEDSMGRKRTEKWGPRIIDIDILLYDDIVVSTPGLTIPHPEIQNRRFTLLPLEEIAGNVTHPGLKKTIKELLQNSTDPLSVKSEGDLD